MTASHPGLWLAGGILVLATVIVSACGGDSEGDASLPTSETPASTTLSGEDAVPGDSTAIAPTTGPSAPLPPAASGTVTSPPMPPNLPASDQPPTTTATSGSQEAEAGIGTYCWSRLCVDKVGVPTLGELAVSSGDTIDVAIPSNAPPLREATATIFEAVDPNTLDDGSTIWLYPGAPGDPIETNTRADVVEVRLNNIDSGSYVLAVSMFFETGDVVYGFLLEVN